MSQSDGGGPRIFGGRYALLDEIGRGESSRVFRARDERIPRDVAVKVLLPGKHDEIHLRRFEREARAAGSLNHPNILVVHDAGEQDGEHYLVTEMLEGETLREALSGGALDPARAADLASQIARGLVAAHEHGIVHRDLKPENLFVTRDGVLKILDFGIAQLPRESSPLDRVRTATGAPVGTVSYMSPEQVHGHEVDARSDLFAFGSLLHEMLTGAPPFDRATVLDTGHAIVADPPPALPRETPAAIARVVARCLEKDRSARFASAREIVEALREAAQSRRSLVSRKMAIVASLMLFSAAIPVFVSRRHPDLVKKFFDPPPRDERPLVAVADIANSTGEPELAALSGLLTVSLEQSRHLSVMTRSRLSDLARQIAHVEPERIDEVLGREIARKANARALLIATVHRLGSKYVVEMRAIDPDRDRYLFTAREEALGKEGLLPVIDRLSERTRRELGDDPAEIESSRVEVGKALTVNLEAFQHYIRGLEQNVQYGEFAIAVKEWRRAVELDPDLAVAHSMLAYAAGWYGDNEERDAHAQAALAAAPRMPDKERAIVLSMAAAEKGDATKAIEQADHLVARYPDDKISLFLAAQALWKAGELQRAETVYRRVLQLDPGCAAVADLIMLLDNSGRGSEALALARQGRDARPTGLNTGLLAWATALAGDVEGAVALAREAIRLNPGVSMYSTNVTYQVLAYGNRSDEAERELRRLMAEGTMPEEREWAQRGLVGLHAYFGKRKLALRAWSELPAKRRAQPLPRAAILGIGRARAQATEALDSWREANRGVWLAPQLAFYGDFAAAEKAASTLVDGSPAHSYYRALVIGRDKGGGQSIDALYTLRGAILRRPDKFLETEILYLLGELLLASGKPEEAIEAMKPLRGPLTVGGNMFELAENWPRAILVRARAYEQLGEIDDALRELDGLLATWKHADADLPLLADARDMRARLGPMAAIAR